MAAPLLAALSRCSWPWASCWASVGAAFNRLVLVTLDLSSRRGRARAGWSLVLALALATAALLFLLPDGGGGGEQIIQPLVAQSLGLQALLVLLLVRLVATLASYAAGAPGGVFAPILGLATMAGLGFAEAADRLLPGLAGAVGLRRGGDGGLVHGLGPRAAGRASCWWRNSPMATLPCWRSRCAPPWRA